MIGRLATSAAILVFILGPTGFGPVAAAQDAVYSADSLMSAFVPGSRNSLKGNTIVFAGAISEISRTRLTFRSSVDDKVFCELASPLSNGDTRYAVGNQITVLGRVRGRGLLGNVTLDQCKALPPPVVPVEAPPPPAPEIVESAPAIEEVVETPAEVAVEPILDVVIPAVPPPIEQPKTKRAIVPAPLKTVPVPVAVQPADPEPTEPVQPTYTADLPVQVAADDSELADPYIQGMLHALAAIILICGAVLVLTKVLPLLAERFRTPSYGPSSDEARRAAIEALLSKENRKRTLR